MTQELIQRSRGRRCKFLIFAPTSDLINAASCSATELEEQLDKNANLLELVFLEWGILVVCVRRAPVNTSVRGAVGGGCSLISPLKWDLICAGGYVSNPH